MINRWLGQGLAEEGGGEGGGGGRGGEGEGGGRGGGGGRGESCDPQPLHLSIPILDIFSPFEYK